MMFLKTKIQIGYQEREIEREGERERENGRGRERYGSNLFEKVVWKL